MTESVTISFSLHFFRLPYLLVPASWNNEITKNLKYIDLSENLLSARMPFIVHCLQDSVICLFDVSQSPISISERNALNKLFNAMDGNKWSRNYGWGSDSDPCLDNWYGVVCSHQGHVTQLLLHGNQLYGYVFRSLVYGVNIIS